MRTFFLRCRDRRRQTIDRGRAWHDLEELYQNKTSEASLAAVRIKRLYQRFLQEVTFSDDSWLGGRVHTTPRVCLLECFSLTSTTAYREVSGRKKERIGRILDSSYAQQRLVYCETDHVRERDVWRHTAHYGNQHTAHSILLLLAWGKEITRLV